VIRASSHATDLIENARLPQATGSCPPRVAGSDMRP